MEPDDRKTKKGWSVEKCGVHYAAALVYAAKCSNGEIEGRNGSLGREKWGWDGGNLVKGWARRAELMGSQTT